MTFTENTLLPLWEREESTDDLFFPLPLSGKKNFHAEMGILVSSEKLFCFLVEEHFRLEWFIVDERVFLRLSSFG